jgi:hypothetical protein
MYSGIPLWAPGVRHSGGEERDNNRGRDGTHMSDEMQIAEERKDMYRMILFLAFASSVDAALFCVFGVLITVSIIGDRIFPLGSFQIWATLVAFTGVVLVGLYYIHKYALKQYSADGELI